MRYAEIVAFHILSPVETQTVVVCIKRVNVVHKLFHVFHHRRSSDAFLVHHVEVGVEIDDEMFLHKCFAAVGHVVGLQGSVLQVLKLFAFIEVEQEVHLV